MDEIRLIDANALWKMISAWYTEYDSMSSEWADTVAATLNDVMDAINVMPTIDPKNPNPAEKSGDLEVATEKISDHLKAKEAPHDASV